MQFVQDDGGRAAAGFRGQAGDCVARAIAIASRRPYDEVYAALARGNGEQRAPKNRKAYGRTAAHGIYTRRKWFKDYMASLGFAWTPTMQIGSGCKVHLHDGELPRGRLVVAVSRHYTAVIDGVVHDTYDPQREDVFHWVGASGCLEKTMVSRRCVYGYWRLA